jgi:hypothetical protein
MKKKMEWNKRIRWSQEDMKEVLWCFMYVKGTVIPVKNGATNIVTKCLWNNLKDVPGKRSVDPLQNTATLETSHVISKVL